MLKLKLRRLQVRAAERGSVVMLIWLGKTYLGQKDDAHECVPNIEVIFGSAEEEEPQKGRQFGETNTLIEQSDGVGDKSIEAEKYL